MDTTDKMAGGLARAYVEKRGITYQCPWLTSYLCPVGIKGKITKTIQRR
jgi:hypothetical protein